MESRLAVVTRVGEELTASEERKQCSGAAPKNASDGAGCAGDYTLAIKRPRARRPSRRVGGGADGRAGRREGVVVLVAGAGGSAAVVVAVVVVVVRRSVVLRAEGCKARSGMEGQSTIAQSSAKAAGCSRRPDFCSRRVNLGRAGQAREG